MGNWENNSIEWDFYSAEWFDDPDIAQSLNLVIFGPSTTASSGAVNMYTLGSASGVVSLYKNVFMYLGVDDAFFANLNLSVSGSMSDPVTKNINMYSLGHETYSSGVEMYSAGHGVSDLSMFMYTFGETTTPSKNMNLYTFGVTGIHSSGINMYTLGLGEGRKTVNMFTRGFSM